MRKEAASGTQCTCHAEVKLEQGKLWLRGEHNDGASKGYLGGSTMMCISKGYLAKTRKAVVEGERNNHESTS